MTSIPRTCLDKRTFDAVDARLLVTLAPRAREAVVCSCVRARTRCLSSETRARGCDDAARLLGTSGLKKRAEADARPAATNSTNYITSRAPTRDETRRSANYETSRTRRRRCLDDFPIPRAWIPPRARRSRRRRRRRSRRARVASRHRPSRRVHSTSHTRSLIPFSRARPRRTLERRDKTDRIVARGRRSAAAASNCANRAPLRCLVGRKRRSKDPSKKTGVNSVRTYPRPGEAARDPISERIQKRVFRCSAPRSVPVHVPEQSPAHAEPQDGQWVVVKSPRT